MILIGITGGIGMGKSLSASHIADSGIPIVDTDLIARKMTARGTEALSEIAQAFGPDVLTPDGELRRERLAALVFPDAGKRRQLEAILHPRIQSVWRDRVADWRQEGIALGAVVIPLLYEKGYEGEFTRIACLACSATTQSQRLSARGWSEDEIVARNAAQLPVMAKMERADYVVWTEGSVASHQSQWDRILASIGTVIGFPA